MTAALVTTATATATRTEGNYLKLLKRGDLSREALEEILADRAARRFHAVRRALAGHPRTPRREALSLVSTLYWRDLAHLSADVRVHPEVRRAADRDLLRRLPDLALAERVDLARTAGRGTLQALRFDREPRVIAAVLDNRFATEPDVVQAAANPDGAPEALAVIASHPRWRLRRAVRSALLRNRLLQTGAGLSLLTVSRDLELRELLESPSLARILRACAERVLAERRSGV
ncbi:MAG: hypothetical protein M3167_11965 [Acidobacteriota bacterium]|nr:hypothetical protein [Acidobacteriota bacterium]